VAEWFKAPVLKTLNARLLPYAGVRFRMCSCGFLQRTSSISYGHIRSRLRQLASKPLAFSLCIIVVGFGCFLLWAAMIEIMGQFIPLMN
jgi:hypothetical protein